jgi:DhnA family fructose-bisphosphate aldolase class Ia
MMQSWAKYRRLEKLKKDNYYLILAMDHALSSGPISGIDSVTNVNKWISFSEENNIPAVVLNHRYIYNLTVFHKMNIVVQTMGLTKQNNALNINKVTLATIDDIPLIDGTAISVQINFNVDNLDEAIQTITQLVSHANKYQYPVLFMVGDADWASAENFNYAIRVCNELGADLIKIHLPSSDNELKKLKKLDENEPILLLAGGENMDYFETRLQAAKNLGFQGVCVGRNIFQSPTPKETLKIIDHVFKTK